MVDPRVSNAPRFMAELLFVPRHGSATGEPGTQQAPIPFIFPHSVRT